LVNSLRSYVLPATMLGNLKRRKGEKEWVMSITSEVISETARKTGESEERVREVAERYGDVIVRISKTRIACAWAGLRCLTCIGPMRKIFWCLVSSLCAIFGQT